ncbi:hypothetical protein C1T31_08625 [Hanstruepera neustonica]|uniref:VWA domain-containing protein n=1 Tax=Hanstruepera neustonica TaxID=1445657 RepID=A0A2K1DYE0_9FLAO|nr:vWA domain-containing protein [Hanstruepera neustonica]PNQ73048.1 hypothetical protein C1T31_08625 [Hanstruepera neustonica]
MGSYTLLLIILSGIIALLLALFQYWYQSKKRSHTYRVLTFLRFITFFLILLLLINPKVEKETFYNEKPKLVIAADNSSSIEFLNQKNAVSGIIQAIKNNKDLNDKFDLEFFAFSDDVTLTDSLNYSGGQTNVSNAFKKLKDIYKSDIAPTILISDGNQTYGSDYEYESLKYNQPVFPVVVGDTTVHADIKLQQLNVNKYAFYKNKFPVEAILTYNGEKSIATSFKILNGNTTVWSENIEFNKTDNSRVINLTLPANQIGVFTYKALVEPLDNEKNTVNNHKEFAMEVVNEKSNIAIVSDFIHPDLGMLKKSIETNEQRTATIMDMNQFVSKISDFQMVILYQPNNRFRPVFEALNTIPLNKLIISGTRTDWNFLNSVSNAFQHDINSQIEDFQAISNTNYSEFILSDLDFQSFPPLRGKFGNLNFSVPFQTILFKQIGSITTEDVLLATMEQNTNRQAILLGEDLWRWRAQSFLNNDSFNQFDDFIGKLIQYLASKKRKERLNVEFESFYNGNTSVIISAQYFNKTYEFDNRENLIIEVTDDISGDKQSFPFVLKNNSYEVNLSNLKASDYSFKVTAVNSNISKSGKFKILAYNIEEQFLNANVSKLNSTAMNTNGKLYFPDTFSKLIDDLLNDTRFATIEKSTKNTVSLISWKYLLALIALCLASEWFIRKYNGLI